jgi:ATP-dependent exoDNAse (exonuclease V) beta subunit
MEPLSGRQEVLDVHALTRALLNPADRVAWLSILRGPSCGLSLASLDLLAGERSHATVTELLAMRLDRLPVADQVRVRSVNATLEAAQRHRADARLPTLVWDAWRALGGESCVDAEQAANVNAYFTMLETMDREGRSLRTDAIESEMDRLCAMPNPDPEARVEVLTIHKAKGREFDTVIVPQMHRRVSHDRNIALHWMEDTALEDPAEAPWYLAPIAATGGDSSNLAEWIKGKKKARQHSELRRLFYVAATRAKKQLHLMATVGVKEHELAKPSAGTLLGVAWCVARNEAEAQLLGIPSDDSSGLAMTAAAAPRIHRLPDAWFAASANATPEELVSSQVKRTGTGQERIPKPSSILASAETRIGGTALHALLERAAHLRAGGESWQTIKAWAANVARGLPTLLVSEGITASKADKAAQNIVSLLQNAVSQDAGRWVLEHRTGALTEYALTHCEDDRAEDLRLDRVFPAGPALLSPGDSDLWIVDYKSASLRGRDIAEFLALQQVAYAAQMSRYAQALRSATGDARPIHCALYFPALDKLHVVAELS